MTLAFLVGGTCSGILFKNIENRMGGSDYSVVDGLQADIDEYKSQGIDVRNIDDPEIKEILNLLDNIPPKWQVKTAGPLGIILAVCAFFMVIVAYMKKNLTKMFSVAIAIMAITLWIITPNIEASMFSGANPKSISLISLIALAICSLFAYLSIAFAKKKEA